MATTILCETEKVNKIKDAIAHNHTEVELIQEEQKGATLCLLTYTGEDMGVWLTAMKHGAASAGLG